MKELFPKENPETKPYQILVERLYKILSSYDLTRKMPDSQLINFYQQAPFIFYGNGNNTKLTPGGLFYGTFLRSYNVNLLR
jgi:hypothetical protein